MQTVLITGCSSGFGLDTAVLLARKGFRVFATMRDLGKRGRLDSALTAAGANADILQLDVTSEPSIAAAVAAALTKAGRIDALVNNAGFGLGGFVEDTTLDDYRRQLETNFFGVVAVTKSVLPHMRRQGAGRIVNISSIGGRAANPVISAYNASKFAVEGFSESLALEARLFGVHVILVEPGLFKTEIMAANRQMASGAADAGSPYIEATRALEGKIDAMTARFAADPIKVAQTVHRALTAPRPRFRYLVGNDAFLAAFLHSLGFRLYTAAIERMLGLGALRTKLRTTG